MARFTDKNLKFRDLKSSNSIGSCKIEYIPIIHFIVDCLVDGWKKSDIMNKIFSGEYLEEIELVGEPFEFSKTHKYNEFEYMYKRAVEWMANYRENNIEWVIEKHLRIYEDIYHHAKTKMRVDSICILAMQQKERLLGIVSEENEDTGILVDNVKRASGYTINFLTKDEKNRLALLLNKCKKTSKK